MHRVALGEGYLESNHRTGAGLHFHDERAVIVAGLELIGARVKLFVGIGEAAVELEQPLIPDDARILELIGDIVYIGSVSLFRDFLTVGVLLSVLGILKRALFQDYRCLDIVGLERQDIRRGRPCKAG